MLIVSRKGKKKLNIGLAIFHVKRVSWLNSSYSWYVCYTNVCYTSMQYQSVDEMKIVLTVKKH